MNNHDIIGLIKWKSPATSYPRIKVGNVEICDHYWTPDNLYEAYGSGPNGESYDYVKPLRKLKMTNLNINGATWMVDDCPHVWTIQKHAKDFHGKVLIAGLGLGLIVHALSKNEKVTEIIVVEREKDVIELIKPLIPNCTIINDDWYNYPVKQADGVFYDLFVGEGESLYMDAIEEMIGLRRKFPNATCRILGFHNDNLQNIADLMLSASKVLLAKQHMRYQNG